MSLHLDARQRAMLREMGVPVWLPEGRETAPAVAAVQAASAGVASPPLAGPPSAANPRLAAANAAWPDMPRRAGGAASPPPADSGTYAPVPASLPAPGALPAEIAAANWPALGQAVAACQACGLCAGRRNTVLGSGAVRADWLVVGDPPDEDEERAGIAFAGQAGQLLDNMLKAVGASRGGEGRGGAYVTNIVKCRPMGARNPEPADLASCELYLRRQVALVQPRVILAMGRLAIQALLQSSVPDLATQPLGRLRGATYAYQGVPVVVTYHPKSLLRNLPDKAKAWADLCRALDVLAAGA